MPVQGAHQRSNSFGLKTARAELMLSNSPMNSIPFSPAQRPPVNSDFAKAPSTSRGHCSSLMLTSDMTSSMNAKFPEVTYDTAGGTRDRTPQGLVPGQNRRGSQRSLTLKPQECSNSQDISCSGDVGKKARSSPWFWHRKSASKTSLTQSASKTLKCENGESEEEIIGASQFQDHEEEASFGSKTSTLSSAFTEDQSDRASVASASRQSEKKGGRFMRFWRNTFSTSSKRYRPERSGSPPACMTQSGLEILAGKQANIAKIFADPSGRLTGPTPRNLHFSNGQGKISSFESLASHDTMDSQSTSEFSDDFHEKDLPTSSPRPAPATLMITDDEYFGQRPMARTDQKPPLSNGRSQSSVSRRRYNSGTLKSIQKMPSMPSQPLLNRNTDASVSSLDRHQRNSTALTENLVRAKLENGNQSNNRDAYCSFSPQTEPCLFQQRPSKATCPPQNGTPKMRRYERERCPSPCSPTPDRISHAGRRSYVNVATEPAPTLNGTLRRKNQQEPAPAVVDFNSFGRQPDASGSEYQSIFRTDQYGLAQPQGRADEGHVYDYPPDVCPQPNLPRQNSLHAPTRDKWGDAAYQHQQMSLAIRQQYVQVADQLQAAVARMPTSAPPPRRRLLGSEYQATDPRISQYEEESLEEEDEAEEEEEEEGTEVPKVKPEHEDRTPTAGRSPRGLETHAQLTQRGVADGTDQHQRLPPSRHEEVVKVPKETDNQALRHPASSTNVRKTADVAPTNGSDRSRLMRRQTFAAMTKKNAAESTNTLTMRIPPTAHSKPSQLTATNPFEGSIHLKRIARPGLENERHRDTSLKVTIHESKNLPPQKRYFCDICLDRKLYARTTSKLFKDSVFWGECFDLNNLPELSFITINLYKEADYSKESKRRKSSKCQNQLMAYLTLAVADLSSKYESQQWHTMQLVNSSTSNTSPLSSMSIASSATTPFSLLQQSSETESCASSLSNIFSASDRTVGSSGGGQATTTNKRSISVAGTAPISSGLLLMGNKSRRAIKYSLGSCEGRLSSLGASLSSSHQNSNLPQIRLVVQYQSVDVLPLAYYDDLRKFVVEKYLPLVEFLEPLLSTKKKEEIARCLVNIHEKADNSDVAEFLAGIVNHELDSYENLSLLFRSNSIGSKAVESYVKLVGAEYLQNLFRTFIENLITSTDDLEVDPTRLPDANSSPQTSSPSSLFSSSESENNSRLVQNQRALMNLVNVVWTKVKASLDYFPHDLRESLASIRRTVEIRHGEEVADQMISGCLFLRYLCPALHGPALFGLTNAVPDEPRVSRNLTLIAKVLQTMANFSHFETKENYMRFMNDFVLATTNEMRSFLRAVSTTTSSINGGGTDVDRDIWIKRTNAMYNCHGSIDLGYELTMMHKYLSAVLEAHPNIPEEINELPNLLRSISQLSTASNLRRSTSGLTSTDSSVSVDHYLREGTQVHGTMAAPMFSHREPKISTISAPQGLGSPGGLEYRPGQLEGHSVNPRNMLYSGLSRRNVSSNPSLLKLDTTDESKSPVKFDNNSENAENEVAIGEVGAGIDSESERLDEKDCLCPTKDQQFFGDNFEFHENSEPAVTATQSKHYADGELCSINEGVVDSFEPTRSISVASTPAKVFCPPPRPPISSSNLRTPNSPVVSSANQRGRSNSFKQRTSLKSAAPTAAVEREKPMEKVSSPRLDRLNGSLRRTSSRNSLRGSLAAVKSPTWDRDSQAGISVSPALYHKWPSGPDIHSLATDGPELAPVAARPTLTLNFPPPPPVPVTTGITSDSIAPPVGELRSTGWSGSCTNIRMGTRAIRMSRERDLSGLGTTGSAATAVSVAERDHSTDVPQISPVPVILQCTEVVNPAAAAKVPVVGSSNDYEYPFPGGSRSIASASSSDLSRAPDAASNLTWPEEGSAAAGGTYVNENLGPVLSMRWPGRPPAARESETTAVVDAFHVSDSSSASQNLCPREAPIEADPFVPASVHRQRRNIVPTDSSAAVSTTNNAPSQAAGSEDDALLAKVYNFLFGNVGAKEPVWGRDHGGRATESENLYQNYQRDSPHGQFVDSGMESLESSHLESLESRLRIMEEQVQQGRNDFQQPATSNNRLQMQDQDMGVNELINQIRLLRLMRQRDAVGHSSSSSSSANLGFPNQNVREILSPPGSAFTFESTRDAQRPDPLTACRTENGCLRPGETPPAPYWTNSSLFDTHSGMPLPLSDPMEAGAGRGPRKQQQQQERQRRF